MLTSNQELYVSLTFYYAGKLVEYGPGDTSYYNKYGTLLAANVVNTLERYPSPITKCPSSSLDALCLYDAAGKLFLKRSPNSAADSLLERFRIRLKDEDITRLTLKINDTVLGDFSITDEQSHLKAVHEIEKLLPKTEYVALDPIQYPPTSDSDEDRESTASLQYEGEDLAMAAALQQTSNNNQVKRSYRFLHQQDREVYDEPEEVQEEPESQPKGFQATLCYMFEQKSTIATLGFLAGIVVAELSKSDSQVCSALKYQGG